MMRIIGLTGGIGTGKSTVSNYLRKKNIFIIDADELSRSLTKKGGIALPMIRQIFSNDVFNGEELDRKKLAKLVFSNPEQKAKLESITTSLVVQQVSSLINELKINSDIGLVIIDAPLLFECNVDNICDETWLVVCDEDIKIRRTMIRDNVSKEDVMMRINNQMSDKEKIKRATRIIDNSADLEHLYSQIDNLLISFK